LKHLITILGHEIRMLLVSAGTYVAAVLFLALMGFVFASLLESYSTVAQETPPAAVYFQLFWLPVFFMVPLLTMRCFAEERRLGTLETLFAAPVSAAEVVLGKFGAAYLLYVSLWGATGVFFWLLRHYASDPRLLDAGPLVGGYLFIAVSGLLFVAVGVWASSITRNQGVAALITFVLVLLIVWGPTVALENFPLLRQDTMRSVRGVLEYAKVFQHLDDFTHGVADVRALLFYLSGASLALVFSAFSVEAKRLHS
jgi:ABC-2 type transport system permease protein